MRTFNWLCASGRTPHDQRENCSRGQVIRQGQLQDSPPLCNLYLKFWACIYQPQHLNSTELKVAMANMEDSNGAQLAQREEEIHHLKINSRFSLPFGVRLPIATSLSFFVGTGLGVSHGSQVAGLRFRAENSHRLPTSPTGWYLYHKSKNYHMAFGGVKEGIKMGAKVSFWTIGFFYIEDMFDRYRGTKDFINTVIASLSVAGAFSMWSMLLPTLQKTF